MANLQEIIEESFTTYAGMALQSRALVDVRDCIKPSARQIFYSMLNRKLTHDKPYKKTANAVGMAMADYYIHGDSSCLGIIMRAGQNFAMRYPLVEVKGNAGNLMESGNWAASRYTESRLGALADVLFADIDKNTITEWRDSYDNTKQFPAVLPTKGYYNIVNGSQGIGVGAAASIPQFNLAEVNAALAKLLLNPDIEDDEIIVMPDFATGGLLLNPAEVKESLKSGTGKACLLRAVVDYDQKDHALVVTEIPYGVYTNTICDELEAIITGEENPGVDRFIDLTGISPLLKIYLEKGADYRRVLEALYRTTSLQSWYTINMTMLKDGRFPRVYGWKEALQAHIDHEKEVYRRGFEHDRNKAMARLHIVEGLLIAVASIEEVIETIKKSSSVTSATMLLQSKFALDEAQAKAVLEIKLARLAHLEVNKLVQEKKDLEQTIAEIEAILNNTDRFNQCLVDGWNEVATKYGDKRRTKVLNMASSGNVAAKASAQLMCLLLDNGSILPIIPEDKMVLNRKNAPITKHNVVMGIMVENDGDLYGIDKDGKLWIVDVTKLMVGMENDIGWFNIVSLLPSLSRKYIVTVTKQGMVKKTLAAEYRTLRKGSAVLKLKEGDELIAAMNADGDDFLFILGGKGGVIKCPLSSFNSTGRATVGVRGISDIALAATCAGEDKYLLVVTEGKCKHTLVSDFYPTARGGNGQNVANGTSNLAVVGPTYYLLDSGKVMRMTGTSLSVKSHMATGAKITKVANPIIVV